MANLYLKFIDLTGQVFGRLTVINRGETSRARRATWICQCVCGRIVLVSGKSLRVGSTKSCGCLHKEYNSGLNLVSQRFDRLVVIELAGFHICPSGRRIIRWVCYCDCSKTTIVSTSNLRSGNVRSCGCLREEAIKSACTKHGLSQSSEYSSWCNMKQRCSDPNHPAFIYYGGRGITICDRWITSFENFYADMGPKPHPNYSIERKNNQGEYNPGNCIWADMRTQSRNTRRNILITFDGHTKTIADWAEILNISRNMLYKRLRSLKWDIQRALTEPSHSSYNLKLTVSEEE